MTINMIKTSSDLLLKCGLFNSTQFKNCIRFKSKKKDHWHNLATKKLASHKALEHFDDFYKTFFRLKWPSVRLALLSPQKYVALVNNFGDCEKTCSELENAGAISLKKLFDICDENRKDELDKSEQNNVFNQSYTLDKVLDAKCIEKESLESIYPDNNQNISLFNNFLTEKEGKSKWHEEDRVIDPDLGIDSGALHEFVPATKLKGMEDYVSEAEYYAYYKPTTDVPLEEEKQYKLDFPENLKVFTHDRGVFERYPQPRLTSTGVLNYFLMDGASLLPMLALGVRPGDVILDMCSAPGGKALAMLQTMLPKCVVCNDLSQSRVNRIHKLMSQYLYDYTSTWKGMISVQKADGSSIYERDTYDKVLVDVPCTNDRLSLHENDNNIFKQSRMKERLRIPEAQAALLSNALDIVKPGGVVVYSTCSLSPVQNDGVVGMALRQLWERQKMQFTVINLEPSLRSTTHLFNYGRNIGLKYGSLIVPFLPSNFGPMYFCKIRKNT